MASRMPILTKKSEGGKDNVGISKADTGYVITTPYGFNLPCSMSLDDRKEKSLLKKYVYCINKALRSAHVQRSISEYDSSIGAPFAALNILVDYIQSGLYRETEKEYLRDTRGKVNFKKTIKSISPSIVNDEPIYTSFVVSHSKLEEDDVVALSQGSVINHFMRNGGELLFGCYVKVNTREIPLNSSLITRLLRVKANSFNSRKQQLVQWIIDYIRGAIIDETSRTGEWKFSIVASTLWEEMVDACYSNQKFRDKTLYGYRFEWIKDKEIADKTAKTEHDTIFEDEDSVIIIDAKNYFSGKDIFINANENLRKQFEYFIEARKQNKDKKIYNLLIKPYIEGIDELGPNGIFPGYTYDLYDKDDVVILFAVPFEMILDSYYHGRKLGPELLDELNKLKVEEMNRIDV